MVIILGVPIFRIFTVPCFLRSKIQHDNYVSIFAPTACNSNENINNIFMVYRTIIQPVRKAFQLFMSDSGNIKEAKPFNINSID